MSKWAGIEFTTRELIDQLKGIRDAHLGEASPRQLAAFDTVLESFTDDFGHAPEGVWLVDQEEIDS